MADFSRATDQKASDIRGRHQRRRTRAYASDAVQPSRQVTAAVKGCSDRTREAGVAFRILLQAAVEGDSGVGLTSMVDINTGARSQYRTVAHGRRGSCVVAVGWSPIERRWRRQRAQHPRLSASLDSRRRSPLTWSSTPSFYQAATYPYVVSRGGKSCGRERHGIPARSTYRTASMIRHRSCSGDAGYPIPSFFAQHAWLSE